MNKLNRQDLLLQNMNQIMIYELINRVNQGILDNHINADLSDNNIHNIFVNSRNKRTTHVSTYIYFNKILHQTSPESKPHKEYAHISIHLTETREYSHLTNSTAINKLSGPIHVVIDQPRRKPAIRIKILPTFNNTNITFSFNDTTSMQTNTQYNSRTILEKYPEFNSALNVLTRYFTKSDPLHLSTIITSPKKYPNTRSLGINTISLRNTSVKPFKFVIPSKTLTHRNRNNNGRYRIRSKFTRRKITRDK